MRLSLLPLAALALALAPPAAPAQFFLGSQADRFELGQRLRLFERALDRYPGVEARRGALPPLEQATFTFFSGQQGEAARRLDRARLLLAAEKPDPAVLWAESVAARPAARFAPAGESVEVTLLHFYKPEGPRPEKAAGRLSLVAEGGKVVAGPASWVGKGAVALETLPATGKLSLAGVAPGDHLLRLEVVAGDKVLATSDQTLSVSRDAARRVASLKEAAAAFEDRPRTTDSATLTRLVTTLDDLLQKKTLETNYPADRLLGEAEELLKSLEAGKPYYTGDRAGQFWLTLAGEKGSAPVRVQVPAAAKAGKPLPLVVAMHGAGGSENMFFDGYGDGLVAKLCAEKGWLLVTTRNGLGAGVVDDLAKCYPVDRKRVYLVGHSMGAGQAVGAASRSPELFAGVAALGGGGGFRGTSTAVKSLPVFVGCGNKDFALGGARSLYAAVQKAGVKRAVFKVYDDVEHLVIVQLALKDVFAFFEGAGK